VLRLVSNLLGTDNPRPGLKMSRTARPGLAGCAVETGSQYRVVSFQAPLVSLLSASRRMAFPWSE
jgi:hypothetical protein